MAFDTKAKDNKPIVDYLKASIALVVDPTTTSRTTIRRTLSEMGAKTSNVEIAEDYLKRRG
jgi:hypothetical protein